MQSPRLVSRHAKVRVAAVSLLALVTVAVIGTARPAQAQLTLTPAGTALGLSLTTFASGFPTDSNDGPLGIAFPSTGGVLVSDFPGNVRLFSTDTDGQSAASAPVRGFYGREGVYGLAQVGGSIYMAAGNGVAQLNSDGTYHQSIVAGFEAIGIVADPANGRLFVSNDAPNSAIYAVDPIAKTAAPFVTNVFVDGLSLSPDGKTLYGADNQTGHILGFSTLNGAQTFDSGYIPGGIDGTVSGNGNLSGNIFANTNGGTFVEINLATDAQTLIASGGSRGDFATADPTNNSLLLTQTDSILRLTPGTGGGFGSPVPEASTTVSFGLLLGLGVCGLMVQTRRRKAQASR